MGAQTLMSPPKANADQQAIHGLLQGSRQDIALIYPKTGDYRSAIILVPEANASGSRDALGFSSTEDGSVEVQFLRKTQGIWKITSSFRNVATQVDRVCFGDFDRDGVQDILIGWGSSQGTTGRTATVCAYLEQPEGDRREYTLGTYGQLALTDLDEDGTQEIFTVDKYVANDGQEEEASPSPPAMARVYQWDGKVMEEKYSVEADNSIVNYNSILFGSISHLRTGVVLDGSRADSSMTTQVFSVNPDSGRLENLPEGVNEEGYSNPFLRPSTAPFLSQDINGDGIIEFPKVTLLPGIASTVTPDSTSYQVEWRVYDSLRGSRPVMRALMNTSENYCFVIPVSLRERLSASNDSERRMVVYTQVVVGNDGEALLGSPLFAIRAFPRSSWESRGRTAGYEMLLEDKDVIYGIRVYTSDSALLSSISKIRENFRLISQ